MSQNNLHINTIATNNAKVIINKELSRVNAEIERKSAEAEKRAVIKGGESSANRDQYSRTVRKSAGNFGASRL